MIFKFIDRKLQRFDFDRERVKKATYVVIIALSVLALILGIACAAIYFGIQRSTVEAGTVFSAAELTGDEDAYFSDGFDPELLNRPGTYYINVTSRGKERMTCIKVVDTRAPVVSIKNINWPLSEKLRAPRPEDFIDSVKEVDEYFGEFIEPFDEFKSFGTYEAKVRFFDKSGNKTKIFTVTLNLVSDNESPRIELISDTVGVEMMRDGEEDSYKKPDYSAMVKISDNCAGDLRIEIDDSGVDYAKKGRYPVYVVGYDMIGNISKELTIIVEIVEEITEE